MAELITVFWRDIPAQVIARSGRTVAKVSLPARFQAAIERAALRAGKGTTRLWIDCWRRERKLCGPALEREARAEAERLEAQYDVGALRALIGNRGLRGAGD